MLKFLLKYAESVISGSVSTLANDVSSSGGANNIFVSLELLIAATPGKNRIIKLVPGCVSLVGRVHSGHTLVYGSMIVKKKMQKV